MSASLASSFPERTERPEWRTWVTPRPLRDAPIHRWFVFPHSFGEDLVTALVEEWQLQPGDRLLDPFVGAGTTLVGAQKLGIPALGFDLSPLAVFASAAKTTPVGAKQLRNTWKRLTPHLASNAMLAPGVSHQDVLQRAFDNATLTKLETVWAAIRGRVRNPAVRGILQLALLSVLPRYSRLVNKGGWLAQQEPELHISSLLETLQVQVDRMYDDIQHTAAPKAPALAAVADARWLPVRTGSVAAIITSPPYPNRHDYTRVFGVELAFAFLDSSETKALRYQSFSSHPESKPRRPDSAGQYRQPSSLAKQIAQIGQLITDPRAKQRIPNMLAGYFRDLYCALSEVERVLKPRGHAAFVVGNVRYGGIGLPVDELLCNIALQVGLMPEEIRVARVRGNSAQQMGAFGREPARESVVLLQKP